VCFPSSNKPAALLLWWLASSCSSTPPRRSSRCGPPVSASYSRGVLWFSGAKCWTGKAGSPTSSSSTSSSTSYCASTAMRLQPTRLACTVHMTIRPLLAAPRRRHAQQHDPHRTALHTSNPKRAAISRWANACVATIAATPTLAPRPSAWSQPPPRQRLCRATPSRAVTKSSPGKGCAEQPYRVQSRSRQARLMPAQDGMPILARPSRGRQGPQGQG